MQGMFRKEKVYICNHIYIYTYIYDYFHIYYMPSTVLNVLFLVSDVDQFLPVCVGFSCFSPENPA